MVRHVRVNRQGRTEAPGRYLLQLSPADMEVVEETRTWFIDGLTDALTQAAADNGWELDGTIDIRFEVDPTRRPGVPNALAVEPGGSKKAQPTAPPPAAPGRAASRPRHGPGPGPHRHRRAHPAGGRHHLHRPLLRPQRSWSTTPG